MVTEHGIFIGVDVLKRRTGANDRLCYDLLKSTIYIQTLYGQDFDDNCQRLACAVLDAERIINAGMFSGRIQLSTRSTIKFPS